MSDNSYGDQGTPASVRAYQKRVDRALEYVALLDSFHDKMALHDYDIVWLRLSIRPGHDQEVLAVIKALGPDGGPVIAFVGGDSLLLVLSKVVRKAGENGFRWKEDKYADDSRSGKTNSGGG